MVMSHPITISLYRFSELNQAPDFATFSSLLRIIKYEMPVVWSRMLDVVRGAYPESLEGISPSKPLTETVFSGLAPHPNEVLTLFVRQNLTFALPLAYYMVARKGLDSLMGEGLPASARLSPKILQVAIKGLIALREMELKELHRLICGPKGWWFCSQPNCPSGNATDPKVQSEAYQKVVHRIIDSGHSGTRLLEVLSLKEVRGDGLGFCESCAEGWEAGHADVRKKAWDLLPNMFGLEG